MGVGEAEQRQFDVVARAAGEPQSLDCISDAFESKHAADEGDLERGASRHGLLGPGVGINARAAQIGDVRTLRVEAHKDRILPVFEQEPDLPRSHAWRHQAEEGADDPAPQTQVAGEQPLAGKGENGGADLPGQREGESHEERPYRNEVGDIDGVVGKHPPDLGGLPQGGERRKAGPTALERDDVTARLFERLSGLAATAGDMGLVARSYGGFRHRQEMGPEEPVLRHNEEQAARRHRLIEHLRVVPQERRLRKTAVDAPIGRPQIGPHEPRHVANAPLSSYSSETSNVEGARRCLRPLA